MLSAVLILDTSFSSLHQFWQRQSCWCPSDGEWAAVGRCFVGDVAAVFVKTRSEQSVPSAAGWV
jgi:hypothetical protein